MPLGFSFAPTNDNAEMGKRGGQPSSRAQDPIKTLHFELPRVNGAQIAGSISPLAGSERAGSSIGQAVLQSVLKTVLGADAASAFLSGSPAAAAQQRPPRMTMPGAPVSDAPRVTGGANGGITRLPDELPTAGFGTTPPAPPGPPTFVPGGSTDPAEGNGFIKVPEPRPSEPTAGGAPNFSRGPGTFAGGMDNESRLNNRAPFASDATGGGAPDFSRGAGTFSGGLDTENRMNNRSPLYYDKFGG